MCGYGIAHMDFKLPMDWLRARNLSVVVNNQAVFSDVSESGGGTDAREFIFRSFDEPALVLPMRESAREESHGMTIISQPDVVLGLFRFVVGLTSR